MTMTEREEPKQKKCKHRNLKYLRTERRNNLKMSHSVAVYRCLDCSELVDMVGVWLTKEDLSERLEQVSKVLSLIKDYIEQTQEVVLSIQKDLEMLEVWPKKAKTRR